MRPVATIVALGVALSVAATAPAAGGPARVRIVDLEPVTAQGLRFGAGERVRIMLNADRRYVRTVRAGRGGSFSARFAFYADACAAFNLRATGASGAVALVTRKLPAQCAALDPVP
nr:hypothetical protein [Gaiellaceae bacterium]